MSTEELAELFLTRPVRSRLKLRLIPIFCFQRIDFAPRFGLSDMAELQKALQYLGDRGFIILASLDPLGGISAGITIDGSVFVESGGETGIIDRYRKDPQAFVKAPSEPLTPSAPIAATETEGPEGKTPPTRAGPSRRFWRTSRTYSTGTRACRPKQGKTCFPTSPH